MQCRCILHAPFVACMLQGAVVTHFTWHETSLLPRPPPGGRIRHCDLMAQMQRSCWHLHIQLLLHGGVTVSQCCAPAHLHSVAFSWEAMFSSLSRAKLSCSCSFCTSLCARRMSGSVPTPNRSSSGCDRVCCCCACPCCCCCWPLPAVQSPFPEQVCTTCNAHRFASGCRTGSDLVKTAMNHQTSPRTGPCCIASPSTGCHMGLPVDR